MENKNGMLDLSESEMLDMWKELLHLEPVRRDCTIERDDGIDLDSLLTTHMRQWYATMLAEAPADLLPVEDVKDEVTLSTDSNGVVTATLPPQCVRPVEVKLQTWQHGVTHFPRPNDPEAKLQQNKWTCGRSHNPAAVDFGDRLALYSGEAGVSPALSVARCVVRPTDGHYRLHQRLLTDLPRNF